MTTILIARHGQSDWNQEKRWQGHADRPLTERGREQAQALADRLAHIELDAVYSSDLQRARDTAVVVAESQGLELRQLPELREVDVGSWSGLTRAEAEERFPEGFARWRDGYPGWKDGETYEAMTDRVLRAVDEIAAEHEGGRVLVVSHGGPIRALKALAAGLDYPSDRRSVPRTDNCEVCVIAIEDGAVRGID